MSSAIAPEPRARPGAPGRPKDLGKRAAILEAAKRLFVELGYDGVSMDQIAAAAGVSKLTVYSHFGDKDALFATAARAYCDQQLPTELFDANPDVPLRERLTQIAQAFYAMVSSPEAVAGHRILCTPQMSDSPLPAMFWDAGPKRVQAEFSELLQRRIEAGELEVDDVARAASQFFTLLKGDLHARLVMGCGEGACREVARAHNAATVDMFLRAYARR
jgi:TetR/AcrR family transcriptional repressor of mexJK operon